MDVTNITNLYHYSSTRKNTNTIEHGTSNTDKIPTSNTDSVTISNEGKAKIIMEQHDVTSMSYNELKKVSDELKNSGVISDEEYLNLTAPPPDFSKITGQAPPDFSAKNNYISVYENKIAFQESRNADTKDIEFNKNILSIFKWLDSV